MTSETQLKPYIPTQLGVFLDGPTTIDWQIEDIMPPGTAGVIAADAGIGKTWLMLDVALSVATGTPWLGHFATRQGSVLIVDEENSELLLRVRLQQLLKGRNISTEQANKLPVSFLVGEGVNLTPNMRRDGSVIPAISFNRLLATVSLTRPALVTFDSLTRIHHANENASNEMACVFSYVKTLIQATNTNCLFSHHFRKAGSTKSGDRIRGSTDLRAFFDYTLLVDRDEDGTLIVEADKNRWAQPVEPFAVRFESAGDSVRFVYDDRQKVTVWDWVRDCLDSNEMSRQDLIDAVKAEGICSVRHLDGILKGRTRAKELIKDTRGRQAFYRLPTVYDVAMMA